MTKEEMVALVDRYFSGVDQENFDEISATLSDFCVFTVETHGVKLTTRSEISTMFTKLWASHAAVLHKDFTYITDLESDRIATQFTVVNTELDGSLTTKSNCNFFLIKGGKFIAIAVYMSGPNTLNGD
jgi:hypothetical protein